jgi:DNA polymerase I
MFYPLTSKYDYLNNGIVFQIYNSETHKLEEWIDRKYNRYFLSDKPLSKDSVIVSKYDACNDENIQLYKCEVNHPSLFYRIKNNHNGKVFEDNLSIFQSYIYDNNIPMGLPCLKENNKLVLNINENIEKQITDTIKTFKVNSEEKTFLENWMRLIEYPAPKFRKLAIDIEVWSNNPNKVPNSNYANYPINAVCLAGSDGLRIAYLLLQKNKTLTNIPDNIKELKIFSDEKEMLLSIFAKMIEYPFILTFNGDEFDLKYMYNRALRLGINDIDIPLINEIRNKTFKVKNSIHIDLYRFFSLKAIQTYAFKNKYKQVSLNNVSKVLINKTKIENDKNISDLNYYELLKYCMNDAELTLELTSFNEDLVMNLILIIQRLTRLPIEECARKNVGAWIKSSLFHEHRQHNYLIPTRTMLLKKGEISTKAVIKGKKYQGAIVIYPEKGIHFNVVVVDFASLYPTLIQRYNLGYSSINCKHPECQDNKYKNLSHHICKNKRSIESLFIGGLRDLRVNIYKKKSKDKDLPEVLRLWYEVAEQAFKVIMNASYGVFGDETFDLYCPPVAEMTTGLGRYVITEVLNKCTELDLNVKYGDTDSLFIKNPDMNKLNYLIDWVNKTFHVELENEKTYRVLCLSNRKKNYLGVIDKDGNATVDVKGLTGKKKHIPPLIKNIFSDIKNSIVKIHSIEDVEPVKQEIIDKVRNVYKTIKHREWESLDDLKFSVTLNKDLKDYGSTIPQHVKVAKYLEDKGFTVETDSEIEYIKIKKRVNTKKGIKFEGDVKPIQLSENEEIDINKYVETLQATCEQIFEPLGISFNEAIKGNVTLSNFF